MFSSSNEFLKHTSALCTGTEYKEHFAANSEVHFAGSDEVSQSQLEQFRISEDLSDRRSFFAYIISTSPNEPWILT